VVLADPAVREQVAARYRASWEEYAAGPPAGGTATTEQRKDKVRSSGQYLADTMHRAPYLLIPVAKGRAEQMTRTEELAAFWGSATSALWSFMLAARARGLGTAWTTLHLVYEKEVAEMIGIPYEHYTQVALTPIAHTIGTDFKPAAREPLDSVTHWDHWST
jgi:nitroreductase